MKSLKLTVINLMTGKDSNNILIFIKQLVKQYTQYNLILIFKMNTRKRTEKRKYPKMINTCVNTAIGNGFIVVKLHCLHFIYYV